MAQIAEKPVIQVVLVLLALDLLLIPSKANAMIDGYNISAYGGPGFELNEHNLTIPVYGVTAAYNFVSPLEVGAEITMRGTIPTLGVDLNYYLSNEVFVGIQVGLDFAQHVKPYLGPQLGFDYLIQPQLSIGPEAQYLYTIHDRSGIFEFLFGLKYYLETPKVDHVRP